jgi:hypothetical protein
MVLLANLVRLVLFLVFVRLLLRALTGFVGGLKSGLRDRPAGPPSGDLVRDRVCNTFLPRERALTATIAGQQEHFCSSTCRERARAAASGA